MRVLLIRPDPGNERFGLGPFFRVEPLGLEYVAAALTAAGHEVWLADLRFGPGLAAWVRRSRPALVGVSVMHALEYGAAEALARRARRLAPGAFLLAGGHAAAAYPGPLETDAFDAVAVDDGEAIAPALAGALARGHPVTGVPSLRVRTPEGWVSTPCGERGGLDDVPLPARALLDGRRARYHCLLFRPVWAVETARGCPFRCSFCSVWQLYGRSFRERSAGAVVQDMASAGPHVFIVDDLFWNHPARSLELARALRRRGVRKRWMLVQSRCDVVARHPELLEAWRPLAGEIDIFFGLEAASDGGLEHLTKDATTGDTLEAARLARSLGYQVTGNFVVDPRWDEARFRELWDFVDRHGFHRAGYTLLTPLPGTELFDREREGLRGRPWSSFDMHHALWEPRLGARRFFELYAETWRRSILSLGGRKRWIDWMRQIRPSEALYLTRVLLRTQRMMKPEAYLKEHPAAPPG
ncbi:MAG TPA: cobalamin-dependent protein [Candidatus Polarisedimenticolia bacterium]|nr:cobalamin-dependent protein [Candidatus Polarisedimenticolia bacterium]